MRNYWLAPILLSRLGSGEVIPGDLLHFESKQAGPFQPLLTMGFGSPPQKITGIFDSGSSDVVVPQAGSAVCQLKNQQCRNSRTGQVLGDFNPNKSKDVERINQDFNATFSGGDGFDGQFVKTAIDLGGGKTVPETQVALAVNGSLPAEFPQFPIFGAGPIGNEATDKQYVNLVPHMKAAGAIKGNVYSVLLNPTRKCFHSTLLR